MIKVMTILKEKYGHNNLKELVMIKQHEKRSQYG